MYLWVWGGKGWKCQLTFFIVFILFLDAYHIKHEHVEMLTEVEEYSQDQNLGLFLLQGIWLIIQMILVGVILEK